MECTAATADHFPNEVQYTALSIDEFSMLSFRNQLEEFRKLGMVFTSEQEFVSLLIPDDAQYPKTHTPYVLPNVPTELSLQETLRHISHLETKLNKLHLLKRQLIKETKTTVRRACLPPSDVRKEYSKNQLLHVLDVCKSINAHKTLLEKLLKRKKSLVVSYKKEAPRSFFVPY